MSTLVGESSAPVHPGVGHIVPQRTLGAVFAALVLLTILTVAATKVDMGSLNLYVALGIAATKAALVVLYFMHLRYDRPFNAIVLAACLVFVALFIGAVLKDARAYRPSLIPGEAPDMKNAHTPLGR
ncbi:MAG: cytochrome C oxidase subunit IV family protein [Thermoguttaceae bacterium]|jgi:cytochrome c oxidase subunit 4